MKTNLKIQGEVELSRTEISQAIIEYLAKHHNYKASKVVYEWRTGVDHPFAIVEVAGTVDQDPSIPSYHVDKKQTREQHSPRKMENIGVFDTMRSILNEYFIKNDKKETLVQYKHFREDILFFFPKMDDKKLRIYLSDKRQFTSNMIWNPKLNQIVVRSIINH